MEQKTFNTRECLLIVKRNGYVYSYSTGGHDMYKRGAQKISLPHKKINPMMFRRLIRENNLKIEF